MRMGGYNRMERWLNPKAFLDSITDLEDALKKDDPQYIRKRAEDVVAARDRFFAIARSVGAVMMSKSG